MSDENRTLRAFAPCRIDLAGGTLDIHPLYLLLREPCTVNLAISIGVEAEVELIAGERSEVALLDRNLSFTIQLQGPSAVPSGGELVASIIGYFHDLGRGPFRVRTRSQSPAGAGIGASSSLCVALTSALAELSKLELRRSDLVRLCLDLEARVLGTPAGYQDFVAASGGGLQDIRYPPGRLQPAQLNTDLDDMRRHMMLFYTGRPHHSGLNNWQVYKACIEGNKDVRSALAEIGYIAIQMAGALNVGDWPAAGQLIDREWAQRRRLSTVVSTKIIDHIIDKAKELGGAGKACGSGGGGCVLVWHNSSEGAIAAMRDAAREVGIEELNWEPRQKGCHVEKMI